MLYYSSNIFSPRMESTIQIGMGAFRKKPHCWSHRTELLTYIQKYARTFGKWIRSIWFLVSGKMHHYFMYATVLLMVATVCSTSVGVKALVYFVLYFFSFSRLFFVLFFVHYPCRQRSFARVFRIVLVFPSVFTTYSTTDADDIIAAVVVAAFFCFPMFSHTYHNWTKYRPRCGKLISAIRLCTYTR